MNTNEYALYKGEELLDIGTITELAIRTGLKKKTLLNYGTPAHLKRTKGMGKKLIKIEEMEAKKVERKDCFAYSYVLNNNCSATINDDCTDCPFYKTTEQYVKDNARTMARLRSLEQTTKNYISGKYKVKI